MPHKHPTTSYFHPDPPAAQIVKVFKRFEIKRLRLAVLTPGHGLEWGNWKQQQRKKCKWGKWGEIQCFVLKDGCDSISNNLNSRPQLSHRQCVQTQNSFFQTLQPSSVFVLFVAISTIAAEVQIGGSFAVFTGNVLKKGGASPGFCVSITISFWEEEKVLDPCGEKKNRMMMILDRDWWDRFLSKWRIIHSIENPESLLVNMWNREKVLSSIFGFLSKYLGNGLKYLA